MNRRALFATVAGVLDTVVLAGPAVIQIQKAFAK